jgi:hypothetical protein
MDRCSDAVYFYENSVKIRKTELQVFQIYYALSEMLHYPF